jgi:hypothetical protein
MEWTQGRQRRGGIAGEVLELPMAWIFAGSFESAGQRHQQLSATQPFLQITCGVSFKDVDKSEYQQCTPSQPLPKVDFEPRDIFWLGLSSELPIRNITELPVALGRGGQSEGASALQGHPCCRNNFGNDVMADPNPLRILDRFLDNAVPADETLNDRPDNPPTLLSSQPRTSGGTDIEDILRALIFRGSSWGHYSRDSQFPARPPHHRQRDGSHMTRI